MKKMIALILTCVMLVSMTACGGSSESTPAPSSGSESAAAEAVTLKFNHTDTAETSYHAAFLEFAAAIEEKSGGSVKMQVYANGELAGERDSLEMMQMGTGFRRCFFCPRG